MAKSTIKKSKKSSGKSQPIEFHLETSTLLLIIAVVIVIVLVYHSQNNNNQNNNKKVKFNLNKNEVHKYDVNNKNDNLNNRKNSNVINNLKNAIKEIENEYKMEEDIHSQDYHRPNEKDVSYRQHLDEKNHGYIVNPNLPVKRQFPGTHNIPINIHTRGRTSYQQIGVLYKDAVLDESSPISSTKPTILPLYGKPTHHSSNKWSYYTATDRSNSVRLPISVNGQKCNQQYGCRELSSGESVSLPHYNGSFTAEIYDYDSPQYIPYVW